MTTTLTLSGAEKELKRLEQDLALRKDEAHRLFDLHLAGGASLDAVTAARNEVAALTKEVGTAKEQVRALKQRTDPRLAEAEAVLRETPAKHKALMGQIGQVEAAIVEALRDIQDRFFEAREAYQEAIRLEREYAKAATVLERNVSLPSGSPKILTTPAMGFKDFAERLLVVARSGSVESKRGPFRWVG